MKLEGVFLDSRLGRRIFLLFVLAATVPTVLLSVLAYNGWTRFAAAQEEERLTQATRYFALTVLDRLLAARQALAAAELDPHAGAADNRLLGIFRGIAIEPGPSGEDSDGSTRASLYWLRHATGQVPARVIIRSRDEATGLTRIAELQENYLWSEAFDEASGERVCVFAGNGVQIFCSAGAGTAAADPQPAGTQVASWNLFLRHEFGVDDWRFTVTRPAGVALRDGLSFVHIAWQVVLATVLLVVILSLVLVRRTTVPLHQLTAGTRRLAAGDYDVRVDVRGADEFGELGAAFNDMAGRIGRQVHQLEVLSSIDREILEASDAARLVPRVLARLAELARGAGVGLGLVDAAVPARLGCTVREPDGTLRAEGADWTPALQAALQSCEGAWCRPDDAPPAMTLWLSALGWPREDVYVAPVRWREQTLAVLLIGGPARPVDVRQVGELRDRVAVALASVARERQLQHRATHDSLTGLLNRGGLQEVLERAVQARRPFGLLLIDLDRFKVVNDTMGHEAGDELLVGVAQRIGHCLPPDALASRLGGDEFVVLVPDAANGHIVETADELVRHVGRPVVLRGTQIATGASLGLAMFPADGQTAADLLRHADMAMYAAKARGRAQVAHFEPALDSAAVEHAVLSRDLARAVERGELRLHYQPRVDACTGAVRSVEALVRWLHPVRGLLMPGAFIELAEETGLIGDLGHWVLQEACRQLAAWRRDRVALDMIAVNLSAQQLRSPDIVDSVFATLRRHGLTPDALELEVTESVMVGDVQATSRLLAQLRAAGVRIAIDDFGTGYSSMAYLRYLPADVLKIDRAFVKDIGSDASADIMVRAIVGLAGSLGLVTVAEGVETAAQAQLLREMGCGELQGYHFARPLPADAIPKAVRAAALASTATEAAHAG